MASVKPAGDQSPLRITEEDVRAFDLRAGAVGIPPGLLKEFEKAGLVEIVKRP
jgi:hypothetical protein